MIVPMPRQPSSRDIPPVPKRAVRQRMAIAALWLVFLGFYASALLFFAASACGYWILEDSPVEQLLELYRIGISSSYYRSVSVTYAIVAFVHAVKCVQLIAPSIRGRRFTFDGRVLAHPPNPSVEADNAGLWLTITRGCSRLYQAALGPTGLLGVSGPCFDLLLLSRELLETVLQTVQAYRMSRLLVRAWLNRFYVSLLVLNCWLMPLVHTAFHGTPLIKYVATLACDLVLDFVSSIVVPLTLIAIYARDVDPAASNLFGLKWFDERWSINAISEFHIILVDSWIDLLSRLVFAVGMISNLGTLQRLVSEAIDQTRKADASWSNHWKSVVPESKRHASTRTSSRTILALRRVNGVVSSNSFLAKLLRIVFVVCGAVVLALHVGAEMNGGVPECAMQVRPWGISKMSCNLVVVNCYQAQIDGAAPHIHSILDRFHPSSVAMMIVRHCPALEVPDTIQSLDRMILLKVYNSTIVRWDASAALTETNHPMFGAIMLMRVQMSGGKIPLGLQAPDFPSMTNALTFLHTNIVEIPDDLDAKWNRDASVHFDTARLTQVPDTLLRMAPNVLVFAGNPLSEVPKALFELPTLHFLDLSYTQVSALPDGVAMTSSRLGSFNLDGTNVSSFPVWVDKWLEFSGDILYPQRISAAGSPYCAERGRIFAGELTSFTATPSEDPSSILMDASTANWDFLKRTVSCTPSPMYRYPIFLEDLASAIT